MFEVSADAYQRFMGAYSDQLCEQMVALAGVRRGQRAVDVGSGPGVLTAVLADRLGAESVAAADPSEPFVRAARQRLPGVRVELAAAEALPFEDGWADATLAQLCVHFMHDAATGVREMRRVTRPGGVVAACVWDYGGRRGPLSPFWRAALELDPAAPDETDLAGVADGQLVRLFLDGGLSDVRQVELTAERRFASFEDWWATMTLGVGPPGAYLRTRTEHQESELRALCVKGFGEDAPVVRAVAWAAVGRA